MARTHQIAGYVSVTCPALEFESQAKDSSSCSHAKDVTCFKARALASVVVVKEYPRSGARLVVGDHVSLATGTTRALARYATKLESGADRMLGAAGACTARQLGPVPVAVWARTLSRCRAGAYRMMTHLRDHLPRAPVESDEEATPACVVKVPSKCKGAYVGSPFVHPRSRMHLVPCTARSRVPIIVIVFAAGTGSH